MVVVLVGVVVGGTALVRSRRHAIHAPSAPMEGNEDDREHRWRGFAATSPGPGGNEVPPPPGAPPMPPPQVPPPPPLPGSPEALEQTRQDEALFDRWRHGILDKNREEVLDCDETFMTDAQRFGPQLEVFAQSEPDDRVRAFSTRVLGKYKNVAAVNVFQRLLTDRSEFVRQNAAWALGELAARPRGRELAAVALGDLQRLQESDPAPDVRNAAGVALKKLQ